MRMLAIILAGIHALAATEKIPLALQLTRTEVVLPADNP